MNGLAQDAEPKTGLPIAVTRIEAFRLRWRSLSSEFLNLLLPPRCVSCGRLGAWFCADCLSGIVRVTPPLCRRCGYTVVSEGLCTHCQTSPLRIECIRSVCFYEGVCRKAIHAFKYDGCTVLARPLGRLMSDYWTRYPTLSCADVVVPVPLHPARLRERGYNQAGLLAREMANVVGLTSDERCLARLRATPPQVGLSGRQRKDNVRGAFCCSGEECAGRQVVLVDDVCTTGATLEACAAALYQAGAGGVRALTLARARRQGP